VVSAGRRLRRRRRARTPALVTAAHRTHPTSRPNGVSHYGTFAFLHFLANLVFLSSPINPSLLADPPNPAAAAAGFRGFATGDSDDDFKPVSVVVATI